MGFLKDLNKPAVDSNRAIQTKLFFGLVDLRNEIGKCFAVTRGSDFRPFGVLELTNCTRNSVPGICHLEFTQGVCRHIVLNHWIDEEVLITRGMLGRPVGIAMFLKVIKSIR